MEKMNEKDALKCLKELAEARAKYVKVLKNFTDKTNISVCCSEEVQLVYSKYNKPLFKLRKLKDSGITTCLQTNREYDEYITIDGVKIFRLSDCQIGKD